MDEASLATRVAEIRTVDPEAYRHRVEEEAAVIEDELGAGTFDNPQAIVGLEYEFYAVDAETVALKRVPRRLLELIGFEKELGLHNAEMTTSPQPLNEYGLAAQEAEVKARLDAALDVTRAEGMRLVSDGLWTIPPEGEDARHYLTDSVESEGVQIATNMSDSPRYHAMANTPTGKSAGMCIDAPNVTLQADTVMPEGLITSIQPHYQVPRATALPQYFRYALRIAGPLLALCVNSPFFPPDLYDDVDPSVILEEAWMEHRIRVFETVLNERNATSEGGEAVSGVSDRGPRTAASAGMDEKVRFPRDLATVEEAVERIVDDDVIVPMAVETGTRFDDRFAHFRHAHGSYWRWVRPVFEGATRSAANARIEFRPIPAQPTVRDSIAVQAAYAGALESFTRLEHPIADLEWERARENFYAAVRDGLDADMTWITNDGEECTAIDAIFEDLLDHAADGLANRGLADEQVGYYLDPLRRRVDERLTPARWKHDRVRNEVEAGADLGEAITTMQRRYVDRQRETLLTGSFVDWTEAE